MTWIISIAAVIIWLAVPIPLCVSKYKIWKERGRTRGNYIAECIAACLLGSLIIGLVAIGKAALEWLNERLGAANT